MSGPQFDATLANGWRHFGEYFFRYNEMTNELGQKLTIQPLRMHVADFQPSKSQRRVLRKNTDTHTQIQATRITPELEFMFFAHKERFSYNVPGSLQDFLGESPGSVIPNLAIQVFLGTKLVAVSFLDVGSTSASSVYGMFDPTESTRSLGHYTMLEEIRWCQAEGVTHYYPGYGSLEPSVYDYKKTFRPLWRLEWESMEWVPLEG